MAKTNTQDLPGKKEELLKHLDSLKVEVSQLCLVKVTGSMGSKCSKILRKETLASSASPGSVAQESMCPQSQQTGSEPEDQETAVEGAAIPYLRQEYMMRNNKGLTELSFSASLLNDRRAT
ncbi:hypothetical protein HPG69_017195 [Diceros bicornis minor]|uniref:Uncharacterized protein n=1 Tax=Diceros bicornis minor TaxID=77932 RepID=A0A7J7ECP2_DICBM|nr:hypothetical protein HPG69_017195 [Diceros bicornis minor]